MPDNAAFGYSRVNIEGQRTLLCVINVHHLRNGPRVRRMSHQEGSDAIPTRQGVLHRRAGCAGGSGDGLRQQRRLLVGLQPVRQHQQPGQPGQHRGQFGRARGGSAGGGSSSAASQIKANWVAFFNPKTPVAKRVSLLQNGATFASIIRAQASSALASSATSSVSAVTAESSTEAKVTYSILVGGAPALKNQPGVAVKQGGVWKVGDQSFCALLTLENNGKAPTACAGAAG